MQLVGELPGVAAGVFCGEGARRLPYGVLSRVHCVARRAHGVPHVPRFVPQSPHVHAETYAVDPIGVRVAVVPVQFAAEGFNVGGVR